MKRLLTILALLISLFASAQTITFNTTPLGGFYARWGVGNDRWQEQSVASGQSVPGYPEPTVYYRRFTVPEVVNPDGSYYWTRFDSKINAAIEAHQKFAFRFFTMYAWPESDNFFNITPTMSGIDGRTGNTVSARSAVPLEWHTAMQAGSPRNWISESGDWVPNYNSSAYLTRLNNLHAAVAAHLNTGSFTPSWSGTPIAYKDVIQYIDVSGFGTWGEWHSYASCFGNNVTTYPGYNLNTTTLDQPSTSTFPTIASMKAIIDAHKNNYGPYQLCIIINAFDAMRLPNTKIPPEVGVYAYQTRTSSGKWMGRRIDHAGEDTGYDDFYLQLNNNSFGGYRLDTASNYRHRLAPFVGEPPGGPVFYNGVVQGQLPIQARKWKLASIGNGNYGQGNVPTGAGADSVRLAFSLMGYHLRITGGSATVTASNFTINANWQNFGLTPTYDHWNVEYTLRNGGGTTMWSNNSAFDPYLFSPEDGNQTKSDTWARPSLPAGTYGLYVTVKDPLAYMTPLQLQITGRTPGTTGGSYFLGNITLGAGPTNQPPVVNAGANQSITGTTATLTGTASDPDGTISSYLWSQASGPNSAGISSPSTASTGLTGLVGGVYVFNLLVTDNNSATASDQVQITVNTNTPPVANAGPNQVITLPTTTATMAGSGSDNIGIASYLWTQIGGLSTTIVAPTTSNTGITGLSTVGVYTYRLTVTDGSGLTNFDDMTITVNAGNTPPIANAGANQTISISTATLSGSLSTDNVGITAYLWTQVGGPVTATIATPTTVGTNISGLSTDGAYIFRLRVQDVAGLFSTDDVQITVNTTGNTAPVANAGPNQTVTLPTNFVQLNGTGSTDNVGIVTYLWTKVDGPASHSLSAPNNVLCNAESMQAGVYTYRLTVTDASGLSSFDDVIITVLALPNTAPIAVAGSNQSLTLPTSSTTVDGSGSSDNVAIINYLWTQVSGPATAVIANAGNVSTGISGMSVSGTYVFRLRVEDVAGLFDTDELTITVIGVANNAPVAAAGSDQTITLPTDLVSLSGSGSTDDVAVTAYLWTQISGPSVATITAATSSATDMDNLVAGTYFFQLQVTDAGGLTDTDDVMIVVNPAVVVPPVVNGKRLIRTNRKFLPRIP